MEEKDTRNWEYVGHVEAMGVSFDEYVCKETNECKQVWYDGYVDIFEIA